jgi:hypothetical protein
VAVLDFIDGTMSIGTWRGAEARLGAGDLALTPAAGLPLQGDDLVVPARVGDDTVTLALDTGAPTSVLYVPRSDDLPQSVSRIATRQSRVRVGDVDRRVSLALIERKELVAVVEPLRPGEPASAPRTGFVAAGPGFAGLLGMDVLRSCVVAFDAERLRVRCRKDPPASLSFDMGAMRTLGPGPRWASPAPIRPPSWRRSTGRAPPGRGSSPTPRSTRSSRVTSPIRGIEVRGSGSAAAVRALSARCRRTSATRRSCTR